MKFKNVISWFEIPTTDINRAQQFYEAIFGIEMIPLENENFKMAQQFYEAIFGIEMIPLENENFKMRMFPIEDPATGIGGALMYVQGFYKPSATDGPLVYLNANPDVQIVLDKVVAAGGQVIVPKTEISPDYGHMAVFLDTEGNRVALHSIPPQK